MAEILRNLRIFDCKRKTANMKLQLIHLFSSVFFFSWSQKDVISGKNNE